MFGTIIASPIIKTINILTMKTKITTYTLAFMAIIMLSSFVSATTNIGSFAGETKVYRINKKVNCTIIKYERAIAVNFKLDEENYVNDIPFNTDVISEEYNYLNAVSENYEISDEEYIDDIPFNTRKMVQKNR